MTAIREAWEIVRRLLAGDGSGFTGRRFSLPQGQRLRFPILRDQVPLLIGTWAPRLSAFAGEEAQELKVGGSANPDVVPVIRERIGNPDVRIVLGAVTVVDEDGDRARSIARREVAMYLAVVAELDPTVSLDPELVARIRALVAAGDDEGAGTLISDDVLDRFAFAGSPEQIAAHVEAVFDAGPDASTLERLTEFRSGGESSCCAPRCCPGCVQRSQPTRRPAARARAVLLQTAPDRARPEPGPRVRR